MNRRFKWEALRRDILGLGEASLHKSHYATLRQRLKELERFRTAIDLGSDLLFILNVPSTRIADVNQVACQQLGIPRNELIGSRFETLLAPQGQIHFSTLVKDFTSGSREQAVLAAELLGFRIGPTPVEIAARFIPGRDSSIVLSVRNIAERQKAEVERKRLEGQLQQSQKLEAIGLLAGGIAHDFNNLLTVILGYVEVLQGSIEDSQANTPMLHEIQNAAKRAAALTNQLLAFSRKQVLQPTVVDLNTLLANTVTMLRRLIGENIELVMEPSDKAARVRADPSQIEQVVLNLVVNARDAMPHGGKLTVRTAQEHLSCQQVIGGSMVPSGEYVTLSVLDTGVGMEEATLERIFEPFFTTKELTRGTGLGLSTVYGIVRQSDAHIAVTSRVGEGSQFTIYFPSVAHPAPQEEESPAVRSLGTGFETVLLVEDEESVRKFVQMVLRSQGYEVLEACEGGEALRICESHSGPIHIIITDVLMPGVPGPDLARKLLSIRPAMKILYISGYAPEALRPELFQTGAPFLQKPFTPAALLAKLRAVLDADRGERASNS